MPPADRQGGEGAEVEAVAKALYPIVGRQARAAAIAALDAVRSSGSAAQNHEELEGEIDYDLGARVLARAEPIDDEIEPPARSPQDEDHELCSLRLDIALGLLERGLPLVAHAEGVPAKERDAIVWRHQAQEALRESASVPRTTIAPTERNRGRPDDPVGTGEGHSHPQDEDHEAGIQAAKAWVREQRAGGVHRPLVVQDVDRIAAYLSRCPSPERDTVRLMDLQRIMREVGMVFASSTEAKGALAEVRKRVLAEFDSGRTA